MLFDPQPILLSWNDWDEGQKAKINLNGWDNCYYETEMELRIEDGRIFIKEDMLIQIREDEEIEGVIQDLKTIKLSRRPVVSNIKIEAPNSWDNTTLSFTVDCYRSLTAKEKQLLKIIKKQIPQIEENIRQENLKLVREAKKNYELLRTRYGDV